MIAEQYEKNIEKIKNLNKNWVYLYWSEKDRHDFIYEYFGWDILNLYLSINKSYGAARADFFRYLCLYKYGGFYLDMKSGLEKPLDNIVHTDDEFITSHWHSERATPWNSFGGWHDVSHLPDGEYQQWFIFCAPGHPIMEKIINQIIENIKLYRFDLHGCGMDAVFRLTGPCVYTRIVYNHMDAFKVRIIDSAKEGIMYHVIPNEKKSTNYREQTKPLVD